MSDKILDTLLAAGFLPNYDKSIFTPVQSIDWLGFTWNLKDGVLEVPLKKMIKSSEIALTTKSQLSKADLLFFNKADTGS